MNQHIVQKLVLFSLLIVGWATPGSAQTSTLDNIPNPKQSPSSLYVSNPDHILSTATVGQLNALLGRLEDSTTAQVAVVCVNSIGNYVPKDFATALFRKWGLGYRQKNNGLLLLLVKDQHRIELETGYGLEGILPDAICSQIQTQKMIPLAKAGDLDGAVLVGVQELVRRISEPEAAKEVYDASKQMYLANQPLENSAVFVLFLLLIPFLGALRILAFFVKKSNPIANQIEKAVAQASGRWAWGFLLYIVMPVCVGFLVVELRHPLSLHGWQILFILYACTGVVLWDGRRRRKNTFVTLFGTLTEPAQYVRQKAAGLNGWGNCLFFPVPFLWLKREDDEAMSKLRDHARQTAEGVELTKVADAQKTDFLTAYQQVEQQLKSVDYDVWRNEMHNITQAIGYENLSDKTYQCCSKCKSRAMYLANTRTVAAATAEREGRGINDYECRACGHHTEKQYSIAISQQRTPSGSTTTRTSTSSGSSQSWGSWGGSSSSSSGSSSSWGGGSSGGGGSGSSW